MLKVPWRSRFGLVMQSNENVPCFFGAHGGSTSGRVILSSELGDLVPLERMGPLWGRGASFII
jgi:hypothetical protein